MMSKKDVSPTSHATESRRHTWLAHVPPAGGCARATRTPPALLNTSGMLKATPKAPS